MRRPVVLIVGICILTASATTLARENKPAKRDVFLVRDGRYQGTESYPFSKFPSDLRSDVSVRQGMFSIAQAGTTWLGADPTGTSVVEGGVWDFDNRGTITCPVGDVPEVYIKNGAFAQGWTSEEACAQKGLYWHAEDFSHPDLACSPGPLQGAKSAWCGVVTPNPSLCFTDAPGYGHHWNQWLCRTVALASANNTLQYTFRSDTESGFDYCYVLIDKEFPDSCGWVGDQGDTIRCYDGANGVQTEIIDLSDLTADPQLCDGITTSSYDGDTVKICFVVTSDGGWDDEDGEYATCDGAMTVDSVFVTASVGGVDTTLYEDFEGGEVPEFSATEGWGKCGGWSSGDYAAIRDINSFVDRSTCGLGDCEMSGCVLAFFDPSIPGQYGSGGHYAGEFWKRAWSPAIYVGGYPPRGYVLKFDRYIDRPISNWIFCRYKVRYKQDPNCPTGAWSPPVGEQYIYYMSLGPWFDTPRWGFSSWVPADAESLKVSVGVWNGCEAWEVPCTNGNESMIYDNIRVGVYDKSAPWGSIRYTDLYTDAFPEADTLSADAWAMIDIATNRSQDGSFLRLGDTLVINLDQANAYAEFCFRVVPGPGTDLGDDFFTTWFPGSYDACETSDVHCARMDTAFSAGSGQQVYDKYFASIFHEDDPRYPIVGGEGVEILPDSLFTPGSKIFYYIRTSYLPGPGPYYNMPFHADPNDVSTMFEVSVLPDMCKDPPACLLYVDYYNRGAQEPIEDALVKLGRTWDRFDVTAETSHQGNGIGNRLLGPGRYRLDRAGNATTDKLIIGPSFSHLDQYGVILINNGAFGTGATFSDGGTGTPDDPTDDTGFLEAWLNQPGTDGGRGLWLSGNNMACDFANAYAGPKPDFLENTLGAGLVSCNYRNLVGHDILEPCRLLDQKLGNAAACNYYGSFESVSLWGSGCPHRYDFDVISSSGLGTGLGCEALLYDRTDQTHPPGYYASVDHILAATPGGADTVRTKIDGFSVHLLRDFPGDCKGADAIARWLRDVLGGVDPVKHPGYFYDRISGVQYCPPIGPEVISDVPPGTQRYSYSLSQNYPNPFRGSVGTTIQYSVAKPGKVELRIFDVAGRLVCVKVEQVKTPGHHTLIWDGDDSAGRKVASGVYFYEVKTGAFTGHKKMVVVR